MDVSHLVEIPVNPAVEQFGPGDTVKVSAKVVEGERERTQVFEGVVIRRNNGGGGANFTTVDTLPYPNDNGPQGIYAHPTAGVFAVGYDRVTTLNKNGTTSTSSAWIVRRSLAHPVDLIELIALLLGHLLG